MYQKEDRLDKPFDHATAMFADGVEWDVPTVFVSDVLAKKQLGKGTAGYKIDKDSPLYKATTKEELLFLLGDVKLYQGVRTGDNDEEAGRRVIVKAAPQKGRTPIALLQVHDTGRMRLKCMLSVQTCGGDLKQAVRIMNGVAC